MEGFLPLKYAGQAYISIKPDAHEQRAEGDGCAPRLFIVYNVAYHGGSGQRRAENIRKRAYSGHEIRSRAERGESCRARSIAPRAQHKAQKRGRKHKAEFTEAAERAHNGAQRQAYNNTPRCGSLFCFQIHPPAADAVPTPTLL